VTRFAHLARRGFRGIVPARIIRRVSVSGLEQLLKDLPRHGRIVKDRGYRQVWRFEADGRAYYLKFYPRRGSRLKRLVRGNPAMREFTRLQWLQKASIPAPRAVAVLVGFRINDTVGDAVILEAIEPAVPLDLHLNDHLLRGEDVPDHSRLAEQVRDIVHRLGQAKLGHDDLHLGNFLLHDGKLFLIDAYAVRAGGLRMDDVLMLGHSVQRFATRGDVLRGWEQLGDGPVPQRNRVSFRLWRKAASIITDENRYFGSLRADPWRGTFFSHEKFPRRWSPVSRLDISADDWAAAWPRLLERVETDQMEVLKRSASGDVLAGDVALGGRPVSVIVKRPRRKYWHRYLTDIGRGSRPRRAWTRAWQLVHRDVPTPWPMLLAEKRTLGYVTDTLIVYERVHGPMLHSIDLDSLSADVRETLFRRLGRTLRSLERGGLAQYDAKSTNWIIKGDETLGPTPVVIDVDGVGRFNGSPDAIRRLLRSLKEHPQYTVADSLAVCQGYAPFAPMHREAEAAV
jgi:tRNA A-37 threonylcarbamoyl transferase component Bud32